MIHFKLSEFDSPDLPGSGTNMDKAFLEKLDKCREIAGVPFVINSGFRTVAHNKKVGGVPNSTHTRGHAADIAYRLAQDGFKILQAAFEVGFNRIGVYKTFIHLDNDPTLPPNVLWSK